MLFKFNELNLADVGDLGAGSDGQYGVRFQSKDGRMFTLRGLTKDECRLLAGLFGDGVSLEINKREVSQLAS